MRSRQSLLVPAVVIAILAAAPVAAQLPFEVSGNIASGAQYDLYTVQLPAGRLITATLVCDETAPGNGDRPLDPVLSVYFPGSDPNNASDFDVYNDDGFGSDDDPAGVDCNAFDSSRVRFTAPFAGDYVFRADGFGSATGPYTLSIDAAPPLQAIPTLGGLGLAGLALLLAAASLLALRRRRLA